jgi:hypothetical protein
MAKKIRVVGAVLTAIIICLFAGSACASKDLSGSALIEGTISHVEAGVDMGPVGGANVTVKCLSNGVSVKTHSSMTGCNKIGGPYPPCGSYAVFHPNCSVGSDVKVTAVKGSMQGSKTDTVKQFYNYVGVGVSWIDVDISAPEVLSALAVALVCAPGFAYALARKKKA